MRYILTHEVDGDYIYYFPSYYGCTNGTFCRWLIPGTERDF